MNLKCMIFGHKPKTTRVVSNNLKECKCLRCSTEFRFDIPTKVLVKLTKAMKETDDLLAEEYAKKFSHL